MVCDTCFLVLCVQLFVDISRVYVGGGMLFFLRRRGGKREREVLQRVRGCWT